MNETERFHVNQVARLRCCVGIRFSGCEGKEDVHHVAEGSGRRSWFAIAKLCEAHHVGPIGLHSGTKAFIRRFRPPGDSEYGLLVWTNEDLAKAGDAFSSWFGSRCSRCGFEYREYRGHLIPCPVCELMDLRASAKP